MEARKMNAAQSSLYSLVLPKYAKPPSTVNVWLFAAQALVIGIGAGGVPVLLYGTLGWGFLMSLQCISFAEFSSAYPSNIGCTLIATKLGGEKYGRFCGFATGYLHFVAGLVTPAALLAANAPSIAAIGTMASPDYVPKTWHIFLIYQATNVLCTFGSARSSNSLDRLATFGGLSLFIIYFASLGTIIAGAKEPAPSRTIWFDFANTTGWPTGLAALVGASLPLTGFGPTHWMMNMADETKNPRKSLPITLLIQQIGNIVMLFLFFLAIGYGVGGDWNAILESPVYTPLGAILDYAIPSWQGAVTIMVLILAFNVLSLVSYFNATIRLMHGFAITGAMPGSAYLAKYDIERNEPANMLKVTFMVTTLLGTLIFATSAVLNTLVGGCMTLYFVGYAPMFMAHILTGGQNLGDKGVFRLPRACSVLLAALNIVIVVFQAISFSLPPESSLQVDSMNWACVCTGTVLLSVVLCWFSYGKDHYNLYVTPSNGECIIQGLDNSDEVNCMTSHTDSKTASKEVSVP
ncbi:amino acid/polyamine transporter I [Boeremia exigua]|uniref:amino acid/polyamine transporter I n=1 Tax=Boeremia exigua TaxID=749465 RepID=UPI001E8E4771|nr:amino acid/polyamine transporter I [Boeremia exigua]KAH6612394.1 amino acid/polyamine transporter I [Boeremia exigua]